MKIVRLFLKTLMMMIYAALALMVLYYPMLALISYVGRETRLFRIRLFMPTEDALLPGFALAVLYALVTALLRRVEQASAVKKDV
ncbi:MAG: hypothetical protein C4532_14045 [Candidatus Abyssobacteria bacterium SURF_17]|uniref:Uncharacterized protein n=1 Tax=Candidatus Abyssobacteria bacterium SURF_17 TaxID=2093361 RepID=A0A419EUF2_9BACT|nr:MAG: hypothetical protein C4532_14045 [Candidatus Abyssubacteria bacterium SURF_17]